ncbi:hypothetical protein EST38_g1618 [Candolleomyces aberdarensis]|uniref:TFIIS N-terminal domain-containing protein n=1 Tax=Candolleomyces aberdarensis TaxID=2316362 RepID=A0A4Q2DUZ0_9AGAR|nr:hypothetical protein EST38_g1618 [Candolleomyces aberdarensis]
MLVDDWATAPTPKDRTTASTAPGVASNPSATASATSALDDMADFTTLDDITGPSTSAAMLSPTSLYGYNYIVPLQSYGAWPPSFVSSSVPLSNYSSLNGATNLTTPASQIQGQGQQQHQSSQQQQSHYQMSQPSTSQNPGAQLSPTSQHMIIDPSLSTMPMNGTLQNQFPASSYPSQASAQQIPYSSFGHALGSYPTAYYRQTAAQGTLSPQVLHSTSAGMPPAMFYGQSPNAPQPPSSAPSSAPSSTANLSISPTISADQQAALLKQQQEQQARARKEQFERSLKPLLQSSAFSGAGAVQTLVDKIDNFGLQDVEASTRLEILTKMRDGAPNHYFRAWSENGGAMEITREWLKTAAKGDGELKDTIMPLLHIIDRLPFTVESLASSKLGKIILKLLKHPSQGAQSKKRKHGEPPAKGAASIGAGGGALPPAKKPAVGTATSTKPTSVKKETKPLATVGSTTTVKGAGTDTGFFSAPKSKPKLPSFKKAQAPPKAADGDVAQPSNVDPFQDILKTMKRKDASPAVVTPPAPAQSPLQQTQTAPIGKNGAKKKKSVTWAVDSELESIRYIERAVYDDDPKDVGWISLASFLSLGLNVVQLGQGTHVNLRDLDRGEGAALHAQMFEEVMDWSEPLPLDPQNELRGSNSEEKNIQEQREQSSLGALYKSSQIPESPGEPSSVLTEEETDQNVTRMILGEENDALFWHSANAAELGNVLAAAQATQPAVQQLLETLAMNPAMQHALQVQQQQQAQPQLPDSTGFNNPMVQQLIQQLQAAPSGPQYGQPGGYEEEQQAWGSTPNHFPTEYGHGYHDDPDHSGLSLHKEGEH